jgi:predicted Zn finger-like uncharacterized protein
MEVSIMKIVCPSCNASYNLPARKIPDGKKVTATCKRCGKKFNIPSHAPAPPRQPVTVADKSVAAAPEEPGPLHSGIEAGIFTEYPDLRTLPWANFDLNQILTENNKGGYKSRKNLFKVKILKSVSGILPRLLHDGEQVVRVAKGTANYPIEVLLGNGLLTMIYNHYAIICTSMRLLFINIDRRMKKPTHYLFQMSYHELKKVRRGSILGSMTFIRNKGKKRVFSGMKRAFSKEIKSYISEKLLASPTANPAHDGEDLCPACFTALGKGLLGCPACKTPYKEPKKALVRSLILPGLGDIYLGHRALGVLELIGSLFVWLIVITSLLAGGEGSLEIAIFLLVIYNGLDGLLTFHMAKKGYMLAVAKS